MKTSKTNIRNLKQLTNDVFKVYSELRNGTISIDLALTLSGIARTGIGGVKTYVDAQIHASKVGELQLVQGDGSLEDNETKQIEIPDQKKIKKAS
jgi:hypothetical protein